MKTSKLKTYLEDLRKTHTPLNTHIPFTNENINTFHKEFKCQRCGHCCTELSPIAIRPSEIKWVAYFLNLSNNTVKQRFTSCRGGIYQLPMPCPFYDKFCKVYQVRPAVCIAYPLQEPIGIKGKKYMQISPICPAVEDLCLKILGHRLKALKK